MNILALDIATVTGWAHSHGGYGIWNLSEAGDERGARHRMLYDLARMTVERDTVELIAIEAAFIHTKFLSGAVRKIEQNAVAHMLAHDIGVPVVEYAPSTIKMVTAGNGHATKQQMIRAVELLYNVRTENDNVADAVAILGMAANNIPGTGAKKTPKKRAKRKTKSPNLFDA